MVGGVGVGLEEVEVGLEGEVEEVEEEEEGGVVEVVVVEVGKKKGTSISLEAYVVADTDSPLDRHICIPHLVVTETNNTPLLMESYDKRGQIVAVIHPIISTVSYCHQNEVFHFRV